MTASREKIDRSIKASARPAMLTAGLPDHANKAVKAQIGEPDADENPATGDWPAAVC